MTSRIALNDEPTAGAAAPAAPPQRVRRAAWVKGTTAVRKYVVLATQAPGELPPLLVSFTDYSADRAEPLKTTLRTASTLEHAEQQVDSWQEENVKRGWKPCSAG